MKKLLRPTLILLAIAMISACDDKGCHYQEGVATLTVSANPSAISAKNGRSTVTAIGSGQDNLPMPDGTLVTFVTDMGAFEQGAQAAMVGGIARIGFLSGGTDGTAKIYGRTGTTVSPTIEVLIGTPAVGSVILIPAPRAVPKAGGKVSLTANVYTADQLPLQGIGVIFSSERGTLASHGGIRLTDDKGQAKDTLTLLLNGTGDQIEIEVSVTVTSTISDTEIIRQDG